MIEGGERHLGHDRLHPGVLADRHRQIDAQRRMGGAHRVDVRRQVASHMAALGDEHRQHRNPAHPLGGQSRARLFQRRFEELEKGQFDPRRTLTGRHPGGHLAQRARPFRIARSVAEQHQTVTHNVFSFALQQNRKHHRI
ncbi:hypothetical protein METUNv1_00275 [Methyloversatilis universalis FAM5]|uniref:Uncharacterized protein n=1 Tax=Methyloversatilis universalis (strain ATCC BAA-1314 / DSM 25237 / JCM 13912 / CCUG 52030 / FAM5) TaxID=1000565 RepID=F5R7R7_METUF|nr:hypothetical protein METUNv1_00275 [Methyloversatilis universalis FAM5]